MHLEMYWWMSSLMWKEHGFEESKLRVRMMNASEYFKQYTDYSESLFTLWNFVLGDFHSRKWRPFITADPVFATADFQIIWFWAQDLESSRKEPFIQQLFFTNPATIGDIWKHNMEQNKYWASESKIFPQGPLRNLVSVTQTGLSSELSVLT